MHVKITTLEKKLIYTNEIGSHIFDCRTTKKFNRKKEHETRVENREKSTHNTLTMFSKIYFNRSIFVAAKCFRFRLKIYRFSWQFK